MWKNKGLDTDAESMNIIFHKDYDTDENNYTKEEIYLLDELMDTMKFESFVYGFIQSYNPIDLYKIPLTMTEEFISILSRKNIMFICFCIKIHIRLFLNVLKRVVSLLFSLVHQQPTSQLTCNYVKRWVLTTNSIL